MEPKRGPRDDNSGIEKTVLLIFSLYSINTAYRLFAEKWPVVVPILVIMSLIAMWIFNVRQLFSFKNRAIISTYIIMATTAIFSVCAPEHEDSFSTFYIMITLIALYGVIECMYVTALISLIVMTFFIVFEKTIFNRNEGWLTLYHATLNLTVLHVCLMLWLKGRKKSINRTIQTIEALKRAERIKDDFLANVSHEIRTPLNTISGMSEIIRNETDINEIYRDSYYIQLATGTLMGTVNDILDFSELQTGNVILENESYNIVTTISDVINMFNAKNENKNIEFIVDLDVSMPKILEGDEKKIRRIIMNLLGNALKFTKDGCVCLSVGGRRESYGWNLLVRIVDTGIGIEEKNIERLFTTYGQVDTSRSRNAEGIGLGLAISKALVEKMGGTILVQSRFGKGSMFQFVVPQKIVDDSPAITIDNKYKLNILTYINREHFNLMEIRDAYTENLRRMIEQVHIKNHACRNLNEFKRRYESDTYTHILITFDEYLEDVDYFEQISHENNLMVVMSQEYETKIKSDSIIKVFKPFYAVPIIKILNETNGKVVRKNEGEFTAPEAHILVVDDNSMNLNVIAGLLNKYKIKTTKAQSGDEALELIESMDYDFVFMDHMMPEKDGIETLNEIRKKRGVYYQKVPIIALTANAVAGAREKFINAGFADFVEKPVELSVLDRVIRRNLPKEKIIYGDVKITKTETKQKEFAIGDLDVKSGEMYCGDREKLLIVLKDFCESSRDIRKGIVEPFEAKDWKTYKINVHALKSSMKSIGANYLSDLAKELEKMSGEGNVADIPEKHNVMLNEYDRVVKFICEDEKIDVHIDEEKETVTDNLKNITSEEFDKLTNDFTEAAYSLDSEAMKSIYEELVISSFNGKPLKGEINSIAKKIEHMDLFSAADLLNSIKEKMKTGGDV